MPGSLPYEGILVPDEAIGADQDRRVVYVVDDTGTISAKPVRTGPILYGYRTIRAGLTGDETIVIDGLVRVRPGVKVKADQVTLPAEANPAALAEMSARLAEALARGLWHPQANSARERLERLARKEAS